MPTALTAAQNAAEAEAETGERDRAAAAAEEAAAAAQAEEARRKFELETFNGPEGERLRRENAILQEAVQRLSARLSNLQAANVVRSGELERLERVRIPILFMTSILCYSCRVLLQFLGLLFELNL